MALGTKELRDVFLQAIRECDPAELTRRWLSKPGRSISAADSVAIVAVGKAAAGLYEGAASILTPGEALVIVPRGYRSPAAAGPGLTVVHGSHPEISEESFEAGRAVRDFVTALRSPIVFLISGGASAAMELPLRPWFTEGDLIAVNRALVRSGLPIASMNVVRKHLSAIKGGRLAAAADVPILTLVYSDVSPGRLADVGSGPTLPDPSTASDAASLLCTLGDEVSTRLASILEGGGAPETPKALPRSEVELIADNGTLVHSAASLLTARGIEVVTLDAPLAADVSVEAARLFEQTRAMKKGAVLIAGGEPTVRVQGDGVGGRCSEMAVRFLRLARESEDSLRFLFAGSDGVDGSSGVAGFALDTADAAGIDPGRIERSVDRSDTGGLMREIAEPIMIPTAGNNLRDLYMVVRMDDHGDGMQSA